VLCFVESRIPRIVRFIILQQWETDVSFAIEQKQTQWMLSLPLKCAEFRFSTSKDSKLHLVLGFKITLLQGRSPVIWQLKSTEERRSIHCLTKSGNQRVQYRRKRIDPLFDDISFITYDNWRDGLLITPNYKGRHSFANQVGEFPNHHVHYLPHSLVQFDPVPNIFTISSSNTKRAKS
jgi:hypothetical protein